MTSFFLAYASYTKKIVDGSPTCDIYPLDVQPQEELENFAKFMEVCLNRLKRKIKPPGGASSATNPNPAGGESPAKPLTLETPLPEIAKAMSFSKPDGVPLLTKSNVPAASASNVQVKFLRLTKALLFPEEHVLTFKKV